MEAKHIIITKSDFPPEIVDRIVSAVESEVKRRYSNEIAKTKEKLAEEVGLSKRTIDRMTKAGKIRSHYIPGFKIPFYFISEFNEDLKKQ